jgi:transcriptional regulator with XRE-family HTH domain
MPNLINIWLDSMSTESNDFFKVIGQRVAQLRLEHGLTQTQLAELVHVKQYVIASYETGRRRLPVSLLPAVAKTLGVSVEDIIGGTHEKTKRGPASRLQRQIEQVRRLPESKQRFVSEFLDTVLQKTSAS